MFNRQNVKEFRNDFQKAVAQLEEQYGVNISLGTISFDGSELRSKMTARKGEKIVRANKDDFQVGDIVGITHKKVSPNDEFKIIKINSKNIKVVKINVPSGNIAGEIRVSPSLLVKK
jgi:poly(3-hydroxyalkanoate) synthetase